jgi:hypothetical protein
MMRHFILPSPVAARPLGVLDPATTARLVTSPSLLQRPATRMGRTIGAVDVAAVAITADDHLNPAARVRAQEQSALWQITPLAAVALGVRRPMAWTHMAVAAMMPLQSCSCTVSGTVPKQNSPVMDRRRACLLGRFLPRHRQKPEA